MVRGLQKCMCHFLPHMGETTHMSSHSLVGRQRLSWSRLDLDNVQTSREHCSFCSLITKK